jgi:hypothetical protein
MKSRLLRSDPTRLAETLSRVVVAFEREIGLGQVRKKIRVRALLARCALQKAKRFLRVSELQETRTEQVQRGAMLRGDRQDLSIRTQGGIDISCPVGSETPFQAGADEMRMRSGVSH